MKKRLLPMLLATAMAFSVAVPTLAADYSDVSAAVWYADAVADMTARGLMNGVGGTLSVLRAEEPNATVLDNAFVSSASNVAGQKAAIESWLDELQEYWK